MKADFKSGFVTLIGRPNVGKSTLMNYLIGQKIAITSNKPQTTRNRIQTVLTTEEGQIVFVDTPGYHDSDKKLNLRLKSVTEDVLAGADCLLYVIDTTREPGDEEKMNAELAAKYADNLVVALNKTDAHDSKCERCRQFLSIYLPQVPGERILEMSAKNDEGINEVLKAIYAVSPEAPALYTEDMYTDQDIAFRISEIIRGEAINRLSQELPHCLYVSVADVESRGSNGKLWVRAFICVERESQKGIVIGKGAAMIKEIRMASLHKIADVFPFKIELDLQVKVDKNWRQKDVTLTRLIAK